jgi:hypothetical protein
MITNDARCMLEVKSSIAMAKEAFNKKNLFVSKLGVNLMKKPPKCCISSTFLYASDIWVLWKLDRKYPVNF